MIAPVKQSASLRRFLAEHPLCCYCGAPAETRDHVPSTQMFDGRQRPKGLEVPACDACNQATKKHEQIVAFIARLSGPTATREQEIEFKDLLRRISKHSPLLHAELRPSWLQQHDVRAELGRDFAGGGPINASGPLLRESTDAFSMKLAHALYYTRAGKIIPPAGGVAHRIYTNWDKRLGSHPPGDLRGSIGAADTRAGDVQRLESVRVRLRYRRSLRRIRCDVPAHILGAHDRSRGPSWRDRRARSRVGLCYREDLGRIRRRRRASQGSLPHISAVIGSRCNVVNLPPRLGDDFMVYPSPVATTPWRPGTISRGAEWVVVREQAGEEWDMRREVYREGEANG